jgi:hypothetical protein
VCAAFLASVVVNYLKDLQSAKNEVQKEKKIKIEKRKDDSIAVNRQDESNEKIVTTFTSALAKYGLKYDSAQKIIQKLVRDSSRKQIIYGNHPELSVSNIELLKKTADSIDFRISFVTKQSEACHTTVKISILVEDSNTSLSYLRDATPADFVSDLLIPIDKPLLIEKNLSGVNLDRIHGLKVYFVFSGVFLDSDNRKFFFKTIDSYDIDKKQYGPIFEPVRIKIIKLLSENGVVY